MEQLQAVLLLGKPASMPARGDPNLVQSPAGNAAAFGRNMKESAHG
jgi:hypothetical protein